MPSRSSRPARAVPAAGLHPYRSTGWSPSTGLSHGLRSSPRAPAISSYMRCAVDGFADDVAVPGVPGQLLDQMQQPPSAPTRRRVLREPRHILGNRHRGVEVGRLEEPQGLGVLLAKRVEQLRRASRRRASRTRPGTRPRCSSNGRSSRGGASGRRGDALHPAALHSGDVFDQAADRQRADRRRRRGPARRSARRRRRGRRSGDARRNSRKAWRSSVTGGGMRGHWLASPSFGVWT